MDLPPLPSVENSSDAQQPQLVPSLPMGKVSSTGPLLGDYSGAFNSVVDAFFKLAEDECGSGSESSLTVPETVGTNDLDTPTSFQLCGGYSDEVQEEEPVFWKRNEEDGERDNADETDEDDDISASSDCVPLGMTDDDAIDEIEFTRELMGYVEGFDDFNLNVRRILEEEEEDDDDQRENQRLKFTPKQHSTQPNTDANAIGINHRPPLPVVKHLSHEIPPPLKLGHRRTQSGGSTPLAKLLSHTIPIAMPLQRRSSSGDNPRTVAKVSPPPLQNAKPSHRRAHSGDSAHFMKVNSPPVPCAKTLHRQAHSTTSRDNAPVFRLISHAIHSTKPDHLRVQSGGSTMPVDVAPEKKRSLLVRQAGHRSLTGRRSGVITCTICGRHFLDGTECSCGMREV